MINTIYRLIDAVAATQRLEDIKADNSSYIFPKTVVLGAEIRAENALQNLVMHDSWGF